MQDNLSPESCHDSSGSFSGSSSSSPDGSPISSTSSSGSRGAASSAEAEAAAAAAAQASSLLATGARNPSPPKKTRSQSPGAVQRRRMQNRIAQRNHRQKVKERQMEENQRRARERAQEQVVQQAHLYSSRSSTASISSNSSLTNYPGQFIQLPGARAQPPGTLHGLGDSFDKGGWIADPTLLPTPDGEIPAYASEYLDMSCTCNTLTGPCVQHCEEMRVQFLGFLSSAQNEPAPLGGGMGGGGASSSSSGAGSVNSAGGAKSVFPGLMGDAHLRKLMQLQQIDPSLHSPPLHSPPVFPDMHQQQHHYQNTSSPFGQQRPPPPPTTTTTTTSNATTLSSPGSTSPCLLPERRSSSPGPNAAKSNNSSNSSSNIHAHINHNTNNSNNNNNNNHSNTSRTRSAATNTSRFKSILTFVRAAGFPDFDSMVASYYTSNFQRNSVADLAQRSSRGRRLGGVLNSLRESAAGWTVWESRQYRESIVEAAQGMYAKELEVVLQRARKTRQRQRQQQQAQPAYLTSPQEQHEQKHQQQQQQTQQTQQQQQEEEEQDTPMFGTGTFPEVPTSSATVISSLLSGLAMPEEMGRVFQDNLPNLWALLTELAGAQGLQCDRVALEALLLLYNARQNPEMDVDEEVPDWHGGAPSPPEEQWWSGEKERISCHSSNLSSTKTPMSS